MNEISVDIDSKTTVALSLETAALWFAGLDDFKQAQFFSLVEDQFETFSDAEGQAYYIAKQADTKARNFIFRLANFSKARGLGGKNQDDALYHYPDTEATNG